MDSEEGSSRYDIPKAFVRRVGGSQKKNLSREITWPDFNFSKLTLIGFTYQPINQFEVKLHTVKWPDLNQWPVWWMSFGNCICSYYHHAKPDIGHLHYPRNFSGVPFRSITSVQLLSDFHLQLYLSWFSYKWCSLASGCFQST